jgi:hypothetical protein
VEKTSLRGFIKPLGEGLNYALVAKLVGANDREKRSWLSAPYKPIYKVRSYVKEKIKPRSIVAYNVIKFGSLTVVGLHLSAVESGFARVWTLNGGSRDGRWREDVRGEAGPAILSGGTSGVQR